MKTLEQTIHEFVRRDFQHQFGKPGITVKDDSEWQKLKATGTRLWLDTGDIDEATKLWGSLEPATGLSSKDSDS